MLALLKYLLLVARRDYVFIGLIVSLAISIFVSKFLGWTSIEEQKYMQIVYSIAGIKMVLTMGIIIFVNFFVKRFYETKEFELFLSYPISHQSIIGAFYSTFIINFLGLLLIASASIFAIYYKFLNLGGFLFWIGSFAGEIMIITAVALFFGMFINSIVFSIGLCFGFVLAAKSFGFFISLIQYSLKNVETMSFMDGLGSILSLVFPRLDLFSYSSWAIYGVDSSSAYWIVGLQTLIYTPMILFAIVFDFRKKVLV